MPKKFLTILIIVGLAIMGGTSIRYFSQKTLGVSTNTQCQAKEMIFYYLDQCEWCQEVKNEGTISKIEQLGVEVKEINAAIGPIRHKFQGAPTFVINEKVYSGYKTFDELKELLGCLLKEEDQLSQNENQEQSQIQTETAFLGERGENVAFENEEVRLDASRFNNNQAQFFNVKTPNGKTIYFFVVKDKNGIYRVAANACAVCFKTYKGFHQEGNEIVCNNCGNRYPIEKIATEKGGCNPGPINPSLEVKDGKVIIEQSDLEQVTDFFNN